MPRTPTPGSGYQPGAGRPSKGGRKLTATFADHAALVEFQARLDTLVGPGPTAAQLLRLAAKATNPPA